MNTELSLEEEMAASSDGDAERCSKSDRSGHSSPDPVFTRVTEMFISEENLNEMENILDIWGNNLKVWISSKLNCYCLYLPCSMQATGMWQY